MCSNYNVTNEGKVESQRQLQVDESARREREAQIFGMPVLAGIPVILSGRQLIRNLSSVATMMADTTFTATVIGVMISRFMVYYT